MPTCPGTTSTAYWSRCLNRSSSRRSRRPTSEVGTRGRANATCSPRRARTFYATSTTPKRSASTALNSLGDLSAKSFDILGAGGVRATLFSHKFKAMMRPTQRCNITLSLGVKVSLQYQSPSARAQWFLFSSMHTQFNRLIN